ncbi:MAG: hypothetical protein ACRETF_05085 [Nevskiaceae bacterium]
MRILTFIIGMVAVTGAAAGEYDARALESDAVAAQVVYRLQFGGASGAPLARSFALQVGNEGQRLAGVAPLRAEYRHDTGQFLVNGVDVERSYVMRQEEGGIAALWGGWLPLTIIVGAAALVIVDGQDQSDPAGSGLFD